MTLVAAVAALLGVALVVPPPGRRLIEARLSARVPRRGTRVADVVFAGLLVAAAGGVAWSGWGLQMAAPVTSVALILVTAVSSIRRAWAARVAGRRADEVARACDLVGSLVSVGHIPEAALLLAAEDCPVLGPVAAAHRVGADIGMALRVAGASAGGAGLVRLARAWEVGHRTGAPLGPALETVATSVRRDREVDQVVAAELAGPRASGQVLAVLPIVGLGAGIALGGDPLEFFLTGVAGPLCLVGGVGLACAGVIWTDALVGRASPRTTGRAVRGKGSS